MLNLLRQAIADRLLLGGSYGQEDIAAAQVALWQFLRSPYFNGNYDHLDFNQKGPMAFALEMETNGRPLLLDPLVNFYPDDWDDENTQAFRICVPPHSFPKPVWVEDLNQVPETVQVKAREIMEAVARQHPRFGKVLAPTPQDFANRQQVQLEVVPLADLEDHLDAVLGKGHNRRLQAEGIRYHEPDYSAQSSRFVIAHNGEEVAGIAGVNTQGCFNYLPYVSVAPGFRQQGLSCRLYQQVIGLCQAEGRILNRSSPSSFTLERPAITRSYDRMLQNSPVLHVTNGGYLERALELGVEAVGMERFFPLAKPICDARLQLGVERRKAEQWEHQQAQQLHEQVASLVPVRSKGTRP